MSPSKSMSDATYHRDKLSVKRVTIAVNGDGQQATMIQIGCCAQDSTHFLKLNEG